jgi:hypothetical protein
VRWLLTVNQLPLNTEKNKSLFQRVGFELSRCEFLGALYGGDYSGALTVYTEIARRVRYADSLSEVAQKALNQLQSAVKKLLPTLPETVAHRFIAARKAIKQKLASQTRRQAGSVTYADYGDWFTGVGCGHNAYAALLQTVGVFQLSVGCSNTCRRCNEWALAGVRKHFSFPAAVQIIEDLYGADNLDYALYGASDPLDWRWKEKTIADLLAETGGRGIHPRIGLLTKIPKGSASIAVRLLTGGADLAVSVTERNRSRVERLEERVDGPLQIHHHSRDLMIPAGLDDDFVTLKSSVTDYYGTEITPEGAFHVIPTFTSALNPTGQSRCRITKGTPWFLKKRVGRDGLQTVYFKPLTVVGCSGREYVLEELLDPQVENVLLDPGEDGPTPPGMMNLSEYFKTFDPDATARRRHLLPSVIKNLRENEGFAGHRGHLSIESHIDAHRAFSDPDTVLSFRHSAVSFLLRSARQYLLRHPPERGIIAFLRQKDLAERRRRTPDLYGSRGTRLHQEMAAYSIPSFDLFQAWLCRLLDNPDDKVVQTYINDHSAAYCPETGRYVAG